MVTTRTTTMIRVVSMFVVAMVALVIRIMFDVVIWASDVMMISMVISKVIQFRHCTAFGIIPTVIAMVISALNAITAISSLLFLSSAVVLTHPCAG